MIARRIVDEIDRLLNEGELSRRKIAERLGFGRSTVCAIARDRRALHGKEAQSNVEPALVAKRCPKCGYVVYLPRLIHVSGIIETESSRAARAAGDAALSKSAQSTATT